MHNSSNCQCILGGWFHCVITHLRSSETGSVSEWSNTVMKFWPSLQYHILWLLITCLIKIRKHMLITGYSCHNVKRKPLPFSLCIQCNTTAISILSDSWHHLIPHDKTWRFLDIRISGAPNNSKKGRKSGEKSTVSNGYICLQHFGN